MTDHRTAEFLAQEYLFLQKTIEDFDARALTVKAWSVTFSAAGLGLAYHQHNNILLLVAAGSALVFWIVESVWKYHQRAFYPRVFEIEAWFRSHRPGRAPFQITTAWRSEFAGGKADWIYSGDSWWKAHLVPFFAGVMLPHLVVFGVGLFLYFAAPPEATVEAVPAATASVPPAPPH